MDTSPNPYDSIFLYFIDSIIPVGFECKGISCFKKSNPDNNVFHTLFFTNPKYKGENCQAATMTIYCTGDIYFCISDRDFVCHKFHAVIPRASLIDKF